MIKRDLVKVSKWEKAATAIGLSAAFVFLAVIIFKADFTKLLFKKSIEELKKPEIANTMTQEEYAERVRAITSVNIQQQIQPQMEAPRREESSKETLLTIYENRLYVPVTIGYNGKMVTIQMMIDTGASGVNISRSVAKRLGIRPENTTTGISIVADGRQVIHHNIEVAFVAVGPKTKKPLQIHIMNREFDLDDGLLGMSFMADFPHMIDMNNKVIRWM